MNFFHYFFYYVLLAIFFCWISCFFTLAGTAIIVGLIGYLFDLFPLVLLNVLPNRIFGLVTNETLLQFHFLYLWELCLKIWYSNLSLLENMSKIWGKKLVEVGLLYINCWGFNGSINWYSRCNCCYYGYIKLTLMIKWNYNKKISAGVICASGTLGQIIPPSIVLVLLADIFQGANEQASQISGELAPNPVSSVDLFAGAIIPGMTIIIFILFGYFYAQF